MHAATNVSPREIITNALPLVRITTLWSTLISIILCSAAMVAPNQAFSQSPEGLEVVSAEGTGRTTGHIATLKIKNTSDSPIKLDGAELYISSNGRYQSYVGRIPEGITINPGQTVSVPVYGYCMDVTKPPVPDGEPMPEYDDWVMVGDPTGTSTPRPERIVPEFAPVDASELVGSPAFKHQPPSEGTSIIVTYPGTDVPVNGTLDPAKDPVGVAPVLVSIVEEIETAADEIQSSGDYPTPYTNDPEREKETIIQQTIWIATGILTDDDEEEDDGYFKEDFAGVVYEQFEETTGTDVDELPEETKEQLDVGVDAFWSTFTATGVKAKVLKEKSPETTPGGEPTLPGTIEIANPQRGCTCGMSMEIDPPYALDMKIAKEYGNEEMRRESIEAVRASLARETEMAPDGILETYDINRHPTSATSFWRGGNVGAFASAYAKTWFKRPDGRWDWVWGTEELRTRAEGNMDFTMRCVHSDDCHAIVAGTAVIRVRASSAAFDAMAGNSHLENDTEQLNFLRGTKWAAKKSLEWLILRGRGKTNKSFRQHVQDDLKDQIEGEITDAVMNEVQEWADKYLGGYLAEMGLTMDDIMSIDFEPPSLIELIEEQFDIDIPQLEELEAFINDGIDATLNLFFVANTYATVNGSLLVRVGQNSGSASVNSTVRYSRESTEETAEAINWSGEDCASTIVSDALPDALTINTQGFVDALAEASSSFGFGNGQAEAFLESMNMQVLASICICPGKPGLVQSSYELNVQGHLAWYTAREGMQSELTNALEPALQGIEDQLIDELDAMSEQQVNDLTNDQFETMLREKVEEWSRQNQFVWGRCDD